VGDENLTDIPAFRYPIDVNREEFYTNSSLLGVRGDHIRLQDVRFAYQLPNIGKNRNVSIDLYTYMSNIGILWKNNSLNLDPQVRSGYPTPMEISFGTHVNF